MDRFLKGEKASQIANSLNLRHRFRHQGLAPFRCRQCNYFSCYRESLAKHYKRAHNIEAIQEMINYTGSLEKPFHEIIFKCHACSFETEQEITIKAHCAEKHSVNSNFDAHYGKAYNCPDCYRSFFWL